MAFKEFFPKPEILLSLAPEELAVYLLSYLKQTEGYGGCHNKLNLASQHNMEAFEVRHREEIARAMMEAWAWLEAAGLIAQDPRRDLGWIFVTRRGREIRDKADFEVMQKVTLLPRKLIHSSLIDKVLPNFIRGDYDTAVFQAFKQVEVAVRDASHLTPNDFGVSLMRKAFDSESGQLTDKTLVKAERESMAHLFAGAIGYFKNPVSHRNVPINDPAEAAEMIIMASHLLRLIEVRVTNPKEI